MAESSTVLAVFLVGVIASVLGAMVGGGSLLSIPLLVFLGLPPQVAIATDRFAGLGAGVTAFYRFRRAGKIVWRYVPALVVASLAGSLVGASVLVSTPPGSLRSVVGILLLVLLPLLFLKRDLGVVPREVSRPRMRLGLALYFLVQVLAGFFGGGTGTLVFYILMAFFGVTITQVAATQTLPFVALTVSSLTLFAIGEIIDYRMGLVLMAGTAVGGYLGAHFAVKSGDRWIRRLFSVVVLGSAVRLLFSPNP
jgi:uncharacterized membrane protein YfcA